MGQGGRGSRGRGRVEGRLTNSRTGPAVLDFPLRLIPAFSVPVAILVPAFSITNLLAAGGAIDAERSATPCRFSSRLFPGLRRLSGTVP